MKKIKLYWSGGNRNEVNFGDSLSPIIVEAITGKSVTYADIPRADMAAIGSLLGKICKKSWKRPFYGRLSPLTIWGSGAFSEQHLTPQAHLNIIALRGKKSADAMCYNGDTLGDPGLLAKMLPHVNAKKKYRWGIIPHVSDAAHPHVQAIHNDTQKSLIIDLAQPDIFETMRQIQSCDFIISTSLHGLVVADCFDVPNIWLRVRDDPHTADWKFLDYFSAIGRKCSAPLHFNTQSEQQTCLNAYEEKVFRPNQKRIDAVNTQLMESLKSL